MAALLARTDCQFCYCRTVRPRQQATRLRSLLTSAAALSSLTRRDLVQLSSETSYGQSVPQQLSTTFDAVLVGGDLILPTHTYILAAASSYFARELAAQDEDSDFTGGLSRLSCKPYVISLTEQDGTQSAQAALKYLYCAFSPIGPEVQSQEDAELLAVFGSKFQVQCMLDASDAFISQAVQPKFSVGYNEVSSCPQCRCIRWFDEQTIESILERLPEVLRLAAFSDSHQLPQTLDFCTKWLAKNLRGYRGSYPELLELKRDALLLVLQAIPQSNHW